MRKGVIVISLIGFLLSAGLVLSAADTFAIPWWVIGAGGRASAGGYTLDAAIVPAASTLSGGAFQLQGGFWAGMPVPTVGPPSRWLYLPVIRLG